MRSSLALALLVTTASVPAAAEPLVGPAVGNADLLVADGARLFNEKKYEEAKASFLKASRVNPAQLPTYLSLARSYFALQDLERACLTYRVYVKNAPETPDREKAQGELELCDRQLAAAGVTPKLSQSFVSQKATFFDALDKGLYSGPASAGEFLQTLVASGYAAPDLGDMAGKLARAAELAAEKWHQKALSHQQVPAQDLRSGAALYQLALDCGATAGKQAARAAFLEGLALLLEGKANQAEQKFEEGAAKDATDTEIRFYRALSKFQAGDKAGALKALETDLPSDPRTAVLRVALAMDGAPSGAAAELERFLYSRKFKSAP